MNSSKTFSWVGSGSLRAGLPLLTRLSEPLGPLLVVQGPGHRPRESLQGAHGLFPKTQTVLSEAHDVDFKSTWVNREALFQVREIPQLGDH